jgi:hypothetical protein
LISAGEHLDASGNFAAKLRDGLPALSVLASEDELPDWVPKLLPLRELEASGLLLRRCQVTELRVLESSGGPLAARGRFLSTPDQTRGALLVQLRSLSPIAAGLSLGAGSDGVTLLAGDDWLAARFAELDGRAREVLRHSCAPSADECR